MNRHTVAARTVTTSEEERGDVVVVEDGRVVEIAQRSSLPADPDVAHDGQTIVPAFIDSHIHPLGYASLVNGTSLKDAASLSDLTDRLREAEQRLPAGQALVAQRLDDTRLGRLPTRHDLDVVAGERPVLIYRYCGHVAVTNTAALALAGIDRDTVDPAGGTLDRASDGQPTGVLRETAVDLVGGPLGPITPPPDDEHTLAALEGLAATGITRIGAMAAASQPLWCGVGDELATLCRLAPDLPIDVDVMVIAETAAELEAAAAQVTKAGGRLRFWGWKGFADGSLGGHTAAMWGPFHDEPTTGTLRLVADDALRLSRTALDLGGVVALHAIGDRAVDETLDVFEKLISEGNDPSRLRVEHLSVASDAAIRRLADLGIVASVQPAFLGSEGSWVPGRLGPDRPAYRFASMRDAGVRMVGGSDSPVEAPDPLQGIHAAVVRSGWNDDQHLTAGEALALFTTSPALHFGAPPPLAPGSPADFVVVDGELGSPEASVAAVYHRGERQDIHPVPWPG